MITRSLYSVWLLLALIGVMASTSSCSKDDLVVIDGNQAPPDSTVATVVSEAYVNRAYIALAGREPSAQEETAALATLSSGNLNAVSRQQMLTSVIETDAYLDNLYLESGDILINGYDSSLIRIYAFNISAALTDTALMPYWDLYAQELDKLQLLLSVRADLYNGSIDRIGVQRRMVNNYEYDQINMGTENFVVSVFDLLLLRYPTDAELVEGKNMVDGFEGSLFLKVGASKDDFLDIFFASIEYQSAQVRHVFNKYLYREPTVEELAQYTALYKTSNSYEAVLLEVLSLDEYVGL